MTVRRCEFELAVGQHPGFEKHSCRRHSLSLLIGKVLKKGVKFRFKVCFFLGIAHCKERVNQHGVFQFSRIPYSMLK
jgi:hypothetical protein